MTSQPSGQGISEDHSTAHIKRFFELWAGDPLFRKNAFESPSSRQQFLDATGIELRASDLDPIWRILALQNKDFQGKDELKLELMNNPLWNQWISANHRIKDQCEQNRLENLATGNERFDAWRGRLISRVQSEALSIPSQRYTPPLFAFELSKGCSKQCWFCAFDPPKLQGCFAYTMENRRLWRNILQTVWEMFGRACRTSVCYHSTEPTDNPSYIDFLHDFYDICGIYPHTTTSGPLKDIKWTRELLSLRDLDPSTLDRFSVISLSDLQNIFRVFSAWEMKNVQLALHNPGSLTSRNHCGRALRNKKRLMTDINLLLDNKGYETFNPQMTLECTIGYLVNMVDRSIKLISPCSASEQWPLGYVIHSQGSFIDKFEFRDFISRSIDQCMQEHLSKDDIITFRDDLIFKKLEDGFSLESRYKMHTVRGNRHFSLLGDLICEGTYTTGCLIDKLIQDGMPVFDAVSWVDRMYHKGFFSLN
jgi:radical SAM family RiPP maturation amino acid epimerase